MINHVKNSITKKSRLTNDVLELHGMSTPNIRHLLNNIVSMPGARYLEVGLWKGATFVSALYENSPDYVMGVDDWSEWSGPEFMENCRKYVDTDFYLFSGDAFDAIPEEGINIYLYDAGHTEEDQYKALEYYYKFLADEFIYMVDDWNLDEARAGTARVIKDLGLSVLYEKRFGEEPYCERVPREWWLGFYISVLRK